MIAVLQFSGGKDSLACLYLLRPHWEEVTVLWVNTGAAYPETLEQMRRVRQMVPHFLEVKSDQPANIARCGHPADVVPIRSTHYGRWATQTKTDAPFLQSYLDCCNANIWKPMQDATMALGATLVIRGQRNSDDRKSPIRSGHQENGVTYWFPLEDWTEQRVREYLASQDVPLPTHYDYVNSSLDCWSCTAYMDDNAGRMRYMKERHPEMWKRYRPMLKTVVDAVRDELAPAQNALEGSL